MVVAFAKLKEPTNNASFDIQSDKQHTTLDKVPRHNFREKKWNNCIIALGSGISVAHANWLAIIGWQLEKTV